MASTHAGGGDAATVSCQYKFFKVLLPGPSRSACPSSRRVSRVATATLGDPTGRSWNVDLKHRTMFFSGGGWRGFVSANGISAGNMLVFEHRGGLGFAVDLFDPSGCLSNKGRCQQEDERVVAEEEEHMTNDTTEVTDGDKESGTGGKRRKKQSPPGSTSTTSGSCEREEGRQQPRDDETLLLCRRIQRPYKLRFLDVSKSFCDRVGWTASRNVELCCAINERKRWPVSVKVTAKGGMLCGGWTEFAQDNSIRLSDACVFFPSGDGDVFHVHVLTPHHDYSSHLNCWTDQRVNQFLGSRRVT